MNWLIDSIRDCSTDMSAKLSKTLMLIIAVSLGVGTFVMSLGSNMTASKQIDNDMAATMVSQISVKVEKQITEQTFPADTEARAMSLPLVQAAGRSLLVSTNNYSLSRDLAEKITIDASSVSVIGITSGYFEVIDASRGTLGNAILDVEEPVNVVYLGEQAAEILGIPTANPYPVGYKIYLNHEPMDVIGVVESTDKADVNLSVFVPYRFGERLENSDNDAVLEVRTNLGAGGPVGRAIREAIRPDNPNLLGTSHVASLEVVRSGVNNQLSQLGVTVGGMLLILTTLLIANSMIVSVLSRTSEIGLRRALGSSSGDIAQLFLLEGAIIGMLGGLAGAAFGTIGNVVLSVANGWSAAMPWWVPILGIAIGLAVGVLASLYPALSAARINPATAIRID